MFVTDGNHGAVRSLSTAVDALALLVDLGSVALGADEDDVALVDAGVVGATVGSLLVAPSEAGAAQAQLARGIQCQCESAGC